MDWTYSKEIIAASILYCETIPDLAEEMEKIKTSNATPCRIVICNEQCHPALTMRHQNLKDDGMFVSITEATLNQVTCPVAVEPTTKLGKAIDTFMQVLSDSNHGLYKGYIYKKEPLGNYFFSLFNCNYNFYAMYLFKLMKNS